MRSTVILLAAVGLAACSPKVPDSAAGVGFQDYNSYIKDQTAPPAAGAPAAPAASSGFSPENAAAAIDAAEGKPAAAPAAAAVDPGAPLAAPGIAAANNETAATVPDGERARGNAPAGIAETTSEMTINTPGVSDEQDFAAVTSRETIESDKARIERNRAQY